MTTVDARIGLEKLKEPECWRLLAGATVGRLAVMVEDRPQIFPVNYVADAKVIYLRTDIGMKLRYLDRNPSVAFEVDTLATISHTGWSVVVTGTAQRITDGDELRHAFDLDIEPWAPGAKVNWVRIDPKTVTGRVVYPPLLRHRRP